MVATRRDGKRVLYRVADDTVRTLIEALTAVARARLAEVNEVVRDYRRRRVDEHLLALPHKKVEAAGSDEAAFLPRGRWRPRASLSHSRTDSRTDRTDGSGRADPAAHWPSRRTGSPVAVQVAS